MTQKWNSLWVFVVFIGFFHQASADPYIVEFKAPLKTEELRLLKSKGYDAEPLVPFKKAPKEFYHYYRVITDQPISLVSQWIPVVSVDRDIQVKKHSVEGGKSLSSDFLSQYQYYLQYSGQTLVRDVDDIRSERLQGSLKASLQLLGLRNKVEKSLSELEPIIVAIVDSGLDRTHPELKEAVYRNSKECDANGDLILESPQDRDENELPGDCQGWDFTAPKSLAHIVKDSAQYNGHGTHISGVLAAKKNKIGIMGVAPNVKILPIRVFHEKDKSPFTFISNVTRAILYAVSMKAQIINLSLGWPHTLTPNSTLKAIHHAQRQGAIVVTSSGNDGNSVPIAPCSISGVFCAGASDVTGQLSYFSNYGLHVDFAAPGENILSTYPVHFSPQHISIQGYEFLSGTSQATPMLSGAIALLKAIYPQITPDEIYARLALSTEYGFTLTSIAEGIPQLNHVEDLKPQPVVRPLVKGFQEVLVQPDQSFQFQLAVKNYWIKSGPIQVRMSFSSQDIQLDQSTFTYESIDGSEVKLISVSGRLLSSKKNRNASLSLEILSKETGKRYSRIHQVDFLSVITQSDFEKFGKSIPLDPNKVLFYQGPELLTHLRTIPSALSINKLSRNYWLPFNTGLVLVLETQQGYQVKTVELENFGQILSIEEGDFDYDHQRDFLVRYESNTDPSFIGYSYISGQGQWYRTLKYYHEGEASSHYIPGSGQWVAWRDSQKNKMALPVWVSFGKTPTKDLSKNPWLKDRQMKESKKSHIYYLAPSLQNSEELQLKILDNTEFIKSLQQKIPSLGEDFIEIRQVRSQNQSDWDQSQTQFLIGFRDRSRNWSSFTLDFDQIKLRGVSPSPISFYEFFGALRSQLEIDGSGFESSLELVISQSKRLMLTAHVKTGYSQKISSPDVLTPLVSSTAKYIQGPYQLQVIESEKDLLFFSSIQSGDFQLVDRTSLERVSFFGSQAFRATFVPMLHREGNGLVPAIYQDSTFLGNRNVVLITYDRKSQKAQTFVKNSYKAPNFCSALTPIQTTNQVFLHMICDLNGELKILKKPF